MGMVLKPTILTFGEQNTMFFQDLSNEVCWFLKSPVCSLLVRLIYKLGQIMLYIVTKEEEESGLSEKGLLMS